MSKMFKSVIKTLFQLCLYIKNVEGTPSPYIAPFPTISTERPPAKTQTPKPLSPGFGWGGWRGVVMWLSLKYSHSVDPLKPPWHWNQSSEPEHLAHDVKCTVDLLLYVFVSFSHGDDMIVTPFAQVSPCANLNFSLIVWVFYIIVKAARRSPNLICVPF